MPLLYCKHFLNTHIVPRRMQSGMRLVLKELKSVRGHRMYVEHLEPHSNHI